MPVKIPVELEQDDIRAGARQIGKIITEEMKKAFGTVRTEAKKNADDASRSLLSINFGTKFSQQVKIGFGQLTAESKRASDATIRNLQQIERASPFKNLSATAKKTFDSMVAGAKATQSAIGSITTTALGLVGGGALTGILSRITGLLTDGAKTGIEYNAQIEKMSVGLTAITGDAQAAAKQITAIKDLAKATPFNFPDLVKATVTMQSMGFSAEEARIGLRGVADASARASLAGESLGQSLGTVSLVLGQINQEEHVTRENLQQLSQRGIPVVKILSEAFNTTEEGLSKLITQGAITGKAAARALIAGFFEAPDIAGFSQKAGQTFEGKLSTVEDAFAETMGAAGKKAFDELKKSLDSTIELLSGEGATKIAAKFSDIFAAPVKLLNSGLNILKADKPLEAFKQFGTETAKEMLAGVTEVLQTGLKLTIEAALNPALESVTKTMTDFFENLKKSLPGLGGAGGGAGIVPGGDALDKLRQGQAPGLKDFFKQDIEDIKKGMDLLRRLGLIGFNAETGTGGLQNIVFQQRKGESKSQAARRISEEARGKRTSLDEIISTQTPVGGGAVGAQGVFSLEDEGTAAQRMVKLGNIIADAIKRNNQFVDLQPSGQISTVLDRSTPLARGAAGTANVLKLATAVKATSASVDENIEIFTKWRGQLKTTGEAVKAFDFGIQDSLESIFASAIGGAGAVKSATISALLGIRANIGSLFGRAATGLIFGGGGGGGLNFGFAGAGAGGGAGGGGLNLSGLFGGGQTGGGGGGFLGGILNRLGIGGGGAPSSGVRTGASISLPIGGPHSAADLFRSAGIGGSQGIFGRAGGFLSSLFKSPGIGSALSSLTLGGSLGSALGGSSVLGKILGGAGGGFLGAGGGLAAFGALGGGLSGSSAALASFALGPIGLAVGGALLVGSLLLGKSKQRSKDEQQADAYWLAEASQLQELTRGVNQDQIEGTEALLRAGELRRTTIEQLNTIKTKSVRDSRLRNQLPDVDRIYVAQLRTAVERQSVRRRLGPQLIPEFGVGGYVVGTDRGYDSVRARLTPGEVVLNKYQQQRVVEEAGPGVFQRAGVPGASFQNGGVATAAPWNDEPIQIYITLVSQNTLTQEEAGELIRQGVRTSTGRKAIVKTTRGGRLNKEF